MVKYKDFNCTIWENGMIILTERILPKEGKMWLEQEKKFKGSLEELAINFKKELFQED